MQHFSPLRIPVFVWVYLFAADVSPAVAQDQEIELERSSLVYSIGRVELLVGGSALIDLGEVQTLNAAAPLNTVAVFRASESRFVPVGVLSAADVYQTFSRMHAPRRSEVQVGDVVMFVRELSQLQSVDQHRDDFIRRQIVETSQSPNYSTFRRAEAARALTVYRLSYPKWERSRATVAGFLNGTSFSEGRERRLTGLLNHIALLREAYRVGRNSVPAAGPGWAEVMNVLYGPTVMAQHEAAQTVTEDPDLLDKKTPNVRDVQRAVRDRFFDRSLEEQNLLSFLVKTMLENPPRSQDVWLTQQILQSQFPELAEEEFVPEQVRLILRDLQRD